MNDNFELRFAALLGEYAERGVRPIDRRAIATAAIAQPRGRWGWLPAPSGSAVVRRRLALIALAALTLTVVAAALLSSGTPPARDRILALIRADGLYFRAADGTERLVVAGKYANVVWSPDGKRLALAHDDSEVRAGFVLLDASGTVTGRTQELPSWHEMAWYPDSERLLTGAVDPQRGPEIPIDPALVVVDSSGGVSRTAVLPTLGDRRWRAAQTISWAPDGRWAAVDLRREAFLCHELLIVPSDAAHTPMLFQDGAATGDCVPHRPAWSSDGRLAVVHSSGEACWPFGADERCDAILAVHRVVVIAGAPLPEGPRTVLVRNADPIAQPLWFPGGDQLLIARREFPAAPRGQSRVSIARADGSGERDVAAIPTRDLRLEWADQGRTVLYRSGGDPDVSQSTIAPYRGELHVLDLETGVDRIIAVDVIAAAMQP